MGNDLWLIVVLAVVAVGATSVTIFVLLRSGRTPSRRGTERGDRGVVTLGQQVQRATEVEVLDTVASGSVFAITDPRNPTSHAWLEVISAEDALLGGSGATFGDGAEYGFAYDALVASIPAGAEVAHQAIRAGGTLRIVGPPEMLAGLADGTLEMVNSSGELIGTVRRTGEGVFAGQLRFDAVAQINPATAALVVFQVMAAVSGQYFMKRIDAKLEEIEKGIARIEGRLKDQDWARLDTAVELSSRVARIVEAGQMPSANDLARLQEADHQARLAFHTASRSLRRESATWTAALSDLVEREDMKPFLRVGVPDSVGGAKPTKKVQMSVGRRKKEKIHAHDEIKARRAAQEDVHLLMKAAVVRARIGMMLTILESGGDPRRARILVEVYEAERHELLGEINAVLEYWRWLGDWTDRDIKDRLGGRVLTRTSRLQSSLRQARDAIEPLLEAASNPESLIPAPPPDPVETTVIEMRRGDDGRVELNSGAVRSAQPAGLVAEL